MLVPIPAHMQENANPPLIVIIIIMTIKRTDSFPVSRFGLLSFRDVRKPPGSTNTLPNIIVEQN